MSSIPVYIGRWQDYSRRNVILGDVVTLDVKWGGYLIAALSIFVGLVGAAAWTIVAFWCHQARAKSGKADLLFAQQQAIYRNQTSSSGAALDILMLCWSWRQRKGEQARVERLKIRSLKLSIPPLAIFIAFTAASLFVANVAGNTYQSNDVKVARNRCGFWHYNISTIQGSAEAQAKTTNDTLAGRSYSRTCYDSNVPLAQCDLFPVKSLPIHTSTVPCPFGDDPTGHNLCRFKNNEALQFDTGLLDSSIMLGINAPKQDRLLARKMVTCSPIYIENYYNLTQDPDGNTIEQYYMGQVSQVEPASYTWIYHRTAVGDEVGYQVESFYSLVGWTPVSALQVSAGDVSLHFLAQNAINYLTPVDDLLFAAHQKFEIDSSGVKYVYRPDTFVAAIACVDQYQVCNPNSTPLDCTIEGTLSQMIDGSKEIGLTIQQEAAAERVESPFPLVNTYSTVDLLSSDPLLAQDTVHALQSTGLPSNQWQIEVNGWVATSLAKFQAYVLEYAANTVDLGPDGYVEIRGDDSDPVTRALKSMCSQQRIRNTGAYQTFSFLGLMVTICLGCAIIFASWILEPVSKRRHKYWPSARSDHREVARIADNTLQLQRMALLGAGYDAGWNSETLLDHMPVAERGVLFPLPYRSDPKEQDYSYPKPEPPMATHAAPETRVNGSVGGSLQQAPLSSISNNAPNVSAEPERGDESEHRLNRDSISSLSATGSGRGRRSSVSESESEAP